VLPTRNGEAHVFAAARAGLLHWRLTGPGGDLVTPPEAHRPAGSVAVARGRWAFAAFHEAATGRLVVLGEQAGWSAVATIDAAATSDPALAVLDGDVPIVAARNGEGRIAVFGTAPTVLSGQIVGAPAFTPDGRHLVALGDDGRMRVSPRPRDAGSPPEADITPGTGPSRRPARRAASTSARPGRSRP
jgi:hypothetical protein